MIKLLNDDCLNVLNEYENTADCIITDPPYGINYRSFRTERGDLVNDDNLEWVDKFCEMCALVLKHECHLYCFVDPEYSAEFVMGFRKHGFKIRNFLTIPRAVKGNGGDRIFQQQFEFCIFATLGTADEGRRFNQTQILAPSEGYKKDKRYNAKEWLFRLPDCWSWTVASEHNSSNIFHPTQKNVECIKDMLRISTNEGDTVIDPFMGSGTTGVACISLNRNFIGIEIDKKYFDVAQKRITEPVEVSLF